MQLRAVLALLISGCAPARRFQDILRSKERLRADRKATEAQLRAMKSGPECSGSKLQNAISLSSRAWMPLSPLLLDASKQHVSDTCVVPAVPWLQLRHKDSVRAAGVSPLVFLLLGAQVKDDAY